ncbi:hypothetical protein [Caballeronia catudaia]|uniref:hypothetical protein n=1 Tax=Caballeronia catudaia TaxID=1777136 RepID=UPI0007722FFC|nr:hypothetical protein [Caballeronia catudaia]
MVRRPTGVQALCAAILHRRHTSTLGLHHDAQVREAALPFVPAFTQKPGKAICAIQNRDPFTDLKPPPAKERRTPFITIPPAFPDPKRCCLSDNILFALESLLAFATPDYNLPHGRSKREQEQAREIRGRARVSPRPARLTPLNDQEY